jgi:hypothetical protein
VFVICVTLANANWRDLCVVHECCISKRVVGDRADRPTNQLHGSTMPNPDKTIDRFAIAARIRALVFARDRTASPGAIAGTLGVRESMLRASIDDDSPHPWIEVLLAVIRVYGVDPTWILTGVYDQSTHREALADEANAEQLLSRTTLAREGKSRLIVLDGAFSAEIRRSAE